MGEGMVGMDSYSIISLVITLLLTVVGVGTVFSIVSQKDRYERITYLRNFKKGKCLLVYIIAIPLYFVGYFYGGADSGSDVPAMVDIMVSTINDVRDLVVLKYKFSGVEKLMQDNSYYMVAVYWCALLAFFNAAFLVFSLCQQYIWEKTSEKRFRKKKVSKYLFLGDTAGNRALYGSKLQGLGALVDDFSQEKRTELYKEGIVNFAVKDMADLAVEYLEDSLKDNTAEEDERKLYIIVNTECDSKNLEICKKLAGCLAAWKKEKISSELYQRINILAYGNPQYETLYGGIADGSGCIRILYKHRKLAMDFVEKYPLALDMGKEQIDYATSLVREGVDINVIFIGFGDVNRQIFLVQAVTDQFVTRQADGTVGIKQVHYHIFDKAHAERNKNLNHNYYRYRNEFFRYRESEKDYVNKVDEDDYLPLPALPSKETYYTLDINMPEFYAQIEQIVRANPKGVNRVLVAYGDDLENNDLAHKLQEMTKNWQCKNVKIFVREREGGHQPKEDGLLYFGNEKALLYNMEEADDSELLKMALRRNQLYAVENEIQSGRLSLPPAKDDLERVMKAADVAWYTRPQDEERDSNTYATLGMRSKLLMMGLDYRKICEEGRASDGIKTSDAGEKGILSFQEYMDIYAGGDLPEYESEKLAQEYGLCSRHRIDFADSRAKNMAIQEHLRWNAYMILQGFVPAELETIQTDRVWNDKKKKEVYSNGKSYALRRHGNLTTFEGLEEFRRLVAERDGCSEEDADVIKYDYQLLDGAWWLLNEMGYGIVRREDCQE